MLRKTAVLTVVTACVAAFMVAIAVPASAGEECTKREWDMATGEYKCVIEGNTGDTGTPPSGGVGPTAPTCDLSGARQNGYEDKNPTENFCLGDNVCFTTDHVVPLLMPEGDKPQEDSKPRVTWCYDGIMGPPAPRRIFWSDDEEPPSLLDQARTAIGNINLGTGTVHVSPQNRTLVNLDTWFWLTGRDREVTGTSAFDLVAKATFNGMSVDPGDGSGSFTCPWTTTAQAAERDCFHQYRRSSHSGSAKVDGRNAFGVSVSARYDLTFEVNGNAVPIPGAPATLDAPVATAALRVDEVQSQVTRVN